MITGTRASPWLDPVRVALDASEFPYPIFFRDDDVGWDDTGLTGLLEVFARHGEPLDLAVIPTALSAPLAADLRTRIAECAVRVHQHGYAHTNHEPVGRKHEFGPSRSAYAQADDIARGRLLLHDAFGADLDPIFTPPWNRCSAETAQALVAQGFDVLSRDHTAVPFDRTDLDEVPVTVDWFGTRKGLRWTRNELAHRLAERVSGGPAVGVMLHHAITDHDERAAIDDLVRLVAGHRQRRATTILQLSRDQRAVSVGCGIPAGTEADGDLQRNG